MCVVYTYIICTLDITSIYIYISFWICYNKSPPWPLCFGSGGVKENRKEGLAARVNRWIRLRFSKQMFSGSFARPLTPAHRPTNCQRVRLYSQFMYIYTHTYIKLYIYIYILYVHAHNFSTGVLYIYIYTRRGRAITLYCYRIDSFACMQGVWNNCN